MIMFFKRSNWYFFVNIYRYIILELLKRFIYKSTQLVLIYAMNSIFMNWPVIFLETAHLTENPDLTQSHVYYRFFTGPSPFGSGFRRVFIFWNRRWAVFSGMIPIFGSIQIPWSPNISWLLLIIKSVFYYQSYWVVN